MVTRSHWLTAQEFLYGLARGQFTPGPVLMAFLPSFLLMLALLPVFDRVWTLVWTRVAMRGIGPAVIGVMAVSLLRLALHAVPDVFALVMFAGTVVAPLYWRAGAAIKVMLGGAALGVLRHRWASLHAVRSALSASAGTPF